MSFSQSSSTFAKAKDSRVSWSSSRKLLSEMSFSPLNSQVIPHSLLLTHPQKVFCFLPFLFFYMKRYSCQEREHQLVQVFTSERVKAYWPATASASSCRLSCSRAISSCSTSQLLLFSAGKSDSRHSLDIQYHCNTVEDFFPLPTGGTLELKIGKDSFSSTSHALCFYHSMTKFWFELRVNFVLLRQMTSL